MRAILRSVLSLVLVALVVSPLHAQKKPRRDPSKITLEELAEYGSASMEEVIPRARPDFLRPPSLAPGDQVMTGVQGVVIYVGTQMLGEPSTLHYYKASDLKEVRYYKPTNAMSPHMSGNAYVIQLIPKELSKP